VLALRAETAATVAHSPPGLWVGDCEGWALPTLSYLDSFFPLTGASHGRALTGRAVVGEELPGGPAFAVTDRTPRLTAPLERYGADPNVYGHIFGAVLQPRLPARTMPGGSDRLRAPDVCWRCDER